METEEAALRATAHLEYAVDHPGKTPAAVSRSASRHGVSKKRGMVHSRWSTEHGVLYMEYGIVCVRPKCEKRQEKIHAPKLLPVKDSFLGRSTTRCKTVVVSAETFWALFL